LRKIIYNNLINDVFRRHHYVNGIGWFTNDQIRHLYSLGYIIQDNTQDFFEYNKDSLYIFRYANYSDIKNILTKIEGNKAILGRGSSQK
jgi:hypothetical protein